MIKYLLVGLSIFGFFTTLQWNGYMGPYEPQMTPIELDLAPPKRKKIKTYSPKEMPVLERFKEQQEYTI